MKIWFCTTCSDRKGETTRLEHIQQTLPQNLSDNPDGEGFETRFVVLNYGDKGGLHEWITTDDVTRQAIEDERLIYARTDQPYFRMGHAKNMAHRMAINYAADTDVICNLDADNWLGQNFSGALFGLFSTNSNVIINPSNEISKKFKSDERGFYGRVALTVGNFKALGGYREAFKGWGDEDTDLTRRARSFGLKYLRFSDVDYLNIITHDNSTRVANMFGTAEEVKAEEERITRQKSLAGIRKVFKAAVERAAFMVRPTVAQLGTHFGMGHINFKGLQQVNEVVGPLKGFWSNTFNGVFRGYFNSSLTGYIELARGRLAGERIISLKDPGGGPQ